MIFGSFALVINILMEIMRLCGISLAFIANPFIQNGIVTYGDIMQFMILYCLVALLCVRDFRGALQLILASSIALCIMLISKKIFVYIARFYKDSIAIISQRPDSIDFDGFPSGHTTAAFVVVGFMCAKYGFRNLFSILCIALAICVGLSRVYAMRHTWLQVICGAILGFLVGYFVVKKIRI